MKVTHRTGRRRLQTELGHGDMPFRMGKRKKRVALACRPSAIDRHDEASDV